LIDSTVIALMVSRTTVLGATLGLTLVAPAVMLSLFGPSKETLVFCMSIIVVLVHISNWFSKSKVVSTALLYLFYGLSVRSYYFLIIAAYVAFLLWATRITELRIAIVGMAAILIMLIPNETYHILQGARDASVIYLKYTSPHVVRTLIESPFPPTGLLNFLLNYMYAFLVCVFPLLIDRTPKELILIIFNLACAFLLVVGLRSKNQAACSLSRLFLAHFIVLLLFEPDLGSYLRHLSNAVLYLVSSTLALEKPDADDLRPDRPVWARADSHRRPESRRACALAGDACSPDGGGAAWRAG
jgi:hypothetical protein